MIVAYHSAEIGLFVFLGLTTLSAGDVDRHFTRNEWLISLESLKIPLSYLLKSFHIRCNFFKYFLNS